jgi:hypothetical protein
LAAEGDGARVCKWARSAVLGAVRCAWCCNCAVQHMCCVVVLFALLFRLAGCVLGLRCPRFLVLPPCVVALVCSPIFSVTHKPKSLVLQQLMQRFKAVTTALQLAVSGRDFRLGSPVPIFSVYKVAAYVGCCATVRVCILFVWLPLGFSYATERCKNYS